MEKLIEVCDDFLPKELVDDIEYICKHDKSIQYSYLNNITGPELDKIYPGMAHDFFKGEIVRPTHAYFYQILYYFCIKRGVKISKIRNGRVFLTFPNLSSDPCYIHTDILDPHYVCLYYVNDADGDTIFFNNKKQEIKRVSPKKGRVIFFDGTILHSGTFPTQYPRFILNFNFQGNFFKI